ncbi:hypothetical protein LWI29_025558 [Acer saccharum]|uniref:Cold regulated gene 27 n=1 Tax=Acer saccharum TaxID=4024 RepID=A0AA39RMI2_ACESA|nr:hypothetical protein LWI29_025558 [Acer saccharum]
MDSYRKTETQTSSRTSEFSLEQQSSGQFAQDDETWSLDPPVAESVSTEWTDEKHRMYLKSMEASFVDQLYNSLDSLGWRSPKKKSSDITSSRQIHRTPSGQFKVLRSGCWQKINFERPDSQLKKTHPSGFLSSPWIRHNKSSCKPQTLASPSLPGTAGLKNQAVNSSGKNAVSCGSASSSEHFAACQSHSCNQDLVDSNTEVSDQNFTDEEIKSEKPSSKCSSKKMNTSRHDQVIPHSNPPETGNDSDTLEITYFTITPILAPKEV